MSDEDRAWRLATGMDSTNAMRLKSAIERVLAAVRAEERGACADLVWSMVDMTKSPERNAALAFASQTIRARV